MKSFSRKSLRLYGIYGKGDELTTEELLEKIEGALQGGMTFFQLREKGISKEEYIAIAKRVKPLCLQYKVPFVINNEIEVAKAVDADGVHLSDSEYTVEQAREFLGEDKIIGLTVNSKESLGKGEESGVDYVSVGATFDTVSKKNAKTIGVAVVEEVAQAAKVPIIAVGGLQVDNLQELSNANLDGVAMISAIFGRCAHVRPERVTARTKEIRDKIDEIFKD